MGRAAVAVTAKTLTPGEAIGNPEHEDYPLLKGRERMMEAVVEGTAGQAFTDMPGHWRGTLEDVLNLDLVNNFRRAVFVSVLNAAMRHAGEAGGTRHCRDDGPVTCAGRLAEYIQEKRLRGPFTLAGFQPRLAEALAGAGELFITDMDSDNIGAARCGTIIQPPEKTAELLERSATVFVTGTTLVNDTIGMFLDLPKSVVFYGVTISGAAQVLGLERFCACAE